MGATKTRPVIIHLLIGKPSINGLWLTVCHGKINHLLIGVSWEKKTFMITISCEWDFSMGFHFDVNGIFHYKPAIEVSPFMKPHGSFWWSESQLNRNPWWSVEKKRPGPESIAPDIPFFSYLKVHHHSQSPSSLSGPSGPHFVAPLVQILHPLSHCTQHQTSPGDRVHSRSTSRSDSCRVSEPPQPHTLMSGMKKMVTSFHPWCSYYIYIYIYLCIYIYIYIYTHSYSYYIIMTVLELEYKMWRKPPVIDGADSWWHPEGPGSFDHLVAISLQECWHILFQNTTTSWLEIDFPHFFAAKNAMFGYFEWGIPPLLRQPHCMRRSGLGFGILLVALADVNLTSYLDMGICPVMVGKNSPGTGSIYIFCRCRLQIPHPKTVTFDKCRIVPHVTGLVHNTYSNYSNQLVPSLLVILGALW